MEWMSFSHVLTKANALRYCLAFQCWVLQADRIAMQLRLLSYMHQSAVHQWHTQQGVLAFKLEPCMVLGLPKSPCLTRRDPVRTTLVMVKQKKKIAFCCSEFDVQGWKQHGSSLNEAAKLKVVGPWPSQKYWAWPGYRIEIGEIVEAQAGCE